MDLIDRMNVASLQDIAQLDFVMYIDKLSLDRDAQGLKELFRAYKALVTKESNLPEPLSNARAMKELDFYAHWADMRYLYIEEDRARSMASALLFYEGPVREFFRLTMGYPQSY